MAGFTPFSPSATVSLATTNSTGNVALSGVGSTLEIQNAGAVTVFVKLGAAGATAAITDYPVLGGMSKVVGIGDSITTAAAITGTGTATVYFSRGEGV